MVTMPDDFEDVKKKDKTEALKSPFAQAKTISDLISVAIIIDNEEMVQTPNTLIEMSSKNNGRYCVNREKLYFQYNDKIYLVPDTLRAKRILKSCGFNQGLFPLNDFYGTDETRKIFDKLYEDARIIEVNDLLKIIDDEKKESLEYSKNQGLKPLSEDLLSRCFKVPDYGCNMKNPDGSPYRDYPHAFSSIYTTRPTYITEPKAEKGFIGTIYRTSYSRAYTFVYIDGSTYVTRSEKVFKQLIDNGFEYKGIDNYYAIGNSYQDGELQNMYDEKVITDYEYEKKDEVNDMFDEQTKEKESLNDKVKKIQ